MNKLTKDQTDAANVAISGSASSSIPAQNGPSLSETTAAGNNRFGDPMARARRLLQAQNNTAPNVPPKPGSTVVSDDAGYPDGAL